MTMLNPHFTARFAYEWLRDFYGVKWPHPADMPPVWEIVLETLTSEQRAGACMRVTSAASPYPTTMEEFLRYAHGSPSKQELSMQFDQNPLVDGTTKWIADRETYQQRNKRKTRWLDAPHSAPTAPLSLVRDSKNVDD